MIQQTSLDSYFNLAHEVIVERQAQVLKAIKTMGVSTNSMICSFTGLPINVITPRCFELRQMGLVVQNKIDICKITGRKAIYWRALG